MGENKLKIDLFIVLYNCLKFSTDQIKCTTKFMIECLQNMAKIVRTKFQIKFAVELSFTNYENSELILIIFEAKK